MTVDSKTALLVVDESTWFSAAKFVEDKSTSTAQKTLMKIWVAIYASLPSRTLVNQRDNSGPSFVYMTCLW